MDPISQGVLGASVAQSFAKRPTLRMAALIGMIGGMAPDLDVLIGSDSDPLLAIEFHRHFTHSLAFIPIGGLLVALLLWGSLLRNKLPFVTILFFATLGYATHGLLDALTSYGTRLFWPFSDYRVTWSVISIIDPIFTVTLVVFCTLSIIRKSKILMRVGLGLAAAYLMVSYLHHNKVASYIADVAAKRGHQIERHFINPTIGNNILWRSVYKTDDNYYIDAVYTAPFSEPILQEGVVVPYIDKETVFPALGSDSVQRQDIRRFAYFSKDFIYIYPGRENVIGDLRYGTLPYDDRSLWGIEVDTTKPNTHVKFGNLRNIEDRHYDELWLMLQGKLNDGASHD